jgi:hypothetical protein
MPRDGGDGDGDGDESVMANDCRIEMAAQRMLSVILDDDDVAE